MTVLQPRQVLTPSMYALPPTLFLLLRLFGSSLHWSAGISLFGCLLLVLTKTGMEFSPDHRFSRTYYSLLGWKIGRWQPLPTIVGVTLKYFSEIKGLSSTYSWGIWNNMLERDEKLIVLLSVQNRSTGIILGYFSLDDVNQANHFAHDIAREFDVPVHVFLPENQFREVD